MSDASLLLRSLRYLRPAQVPRRAARLVLEEALLDAGILERSVRSAPAFAGTSRDHPRARVLRDRTPQMPVDWHDLRLSRLGRFELHSMRWAWATDDGALHVLVDDWRERNPPRRGDGWHPFVVAERLLNLLPRGAGDPLSLWRQARFLALALEHDIGGNHLLREAVALAVAGEAFRDERLWRRGATLARRETARQILPDGGHYERSPAYHLEVLLDVATVPGLGGTATLDRMARFAASMAHPDGTPALFNDGRLLDLGVPAFLDALGLAATTVSSFPDTGFWRFGAGGDVLFMDAGPPSPDDLPAHAHCDLLSIEASVDGERIVVDSGTGDYERGTWRDYWRSTRAHNTVEVDGREQSRVWHSFRMAERARPREVRELSGDARGLSAAHDGYRPVLHRRTLVDLTNAWLVADRLEGGGVHEVRSFLHLHPNAHIERGGTVRRGVAALRVVPFGLPVAPPADGHYAERIGQRRPARALLLEARTPLPVSFGWLLVRGGASGAVRQLNDGFEVTVGDDIRTVRVRGDRIGLA